MNNIQKVSDFFMCSNCGACKAICPKDAKNITKSTIGRMYATVNESCIECGLCTKICPSLDTTLHKTFPDKYVGHIDNIYIGRSTNKQIFNNAQSGGICTAALEFLFKTKKIEAAVVCKMLSGNPPIVTSFIATDINQLYECQKSCYTPVDMLSAIKDTVKFKSIALVGLPCHIQGAVNLEKTIKKYSNIKYKIGLICDRTLCESIQNVMIGFCSNDTAKIHWREKNVHKGNSYYPYRTAPIVISYDKGNEYILPNIYRLSLKEMFTAPRCRICYDKLNTFADIVVGDPWGMSNVDWEKGDSVIITRTITGQKLIEELEDSNSAILNKANIEELLTGQHIIKRKKSVSIWSNVLAAFTNNSIDSYLLKQQDIESMPFSQIQKAQKEFLQFIEREKLSQEEIVLQAQKHVKKSIYLTNIRRWMPINILRKFKSIINK